MISPGSALPSAPTHTITAERCLATAQAVRVKVKGLLTLGCFLHQIGIVGLDRSRPVPKAFRPSTALRPLAGPRALAECRISIEARVRQRHWSIQCQTSLCLAFRAAP